MGKKKTNKKTNCGAGKDSWKSLGHQGNQIGQSQRKLTLNIHWKDCCWSWSSNTLATWCEEPTHWKTDWCWERLGAAEDEMVGWHPWLNAHEFEQTLGDSEGLGSLACWSPCGSKELDMTEQQNNNSCKNTTSVKVQNMAPYTASGNLWSELCYYSLPFPEYCTHRIRQYIGLWVWPRFLSRMHWRFTAGLGVSSFHSFSFYFKGSSFIYFSIIYFWLHWVFVAACWLSLVEVVWLWLWWFLILWTMSSRACVLSSCAVWS